MTKLTKRHVISAMGIGAAAVVAGVTLSPSQAASTNWRAWDTVTRSSPGGWLSQRAYAVRQARAWKRRFPGHRIEIHRTGPNGSWTNYAVETRDFR